MTIDPISLKLAEIVLKWTVDKATNKIDKIDFKDPATREKLNRACKAYIDSYRHRYGNIQAELETCRFESANVLTQALLTKGGMLILLDGLDEIPS